MKPSSIIIFNKSLKFIYPVDMFSALHFLNFIFNSTLKNIDISINIINNIILKNSSNIINVQGVINTII